MGLSTLDDDAVGVRAGHQRAAAVADHAGGHVGEDMQPEHRLGLVPLEHAFLDHQRGTPLLARRGTLLGRLEQEHHRPRKLGTHRCERLGDAHEHGRVRVMAAGVHHTDGLVAVGGGGTRAERQIDLLGDGQCVHVRAQRDGRTGLAALEHTHHTGLGDAGLHLEAEALQVIGHDLRGAELAVGEFGVLVKIAPPTDHPRLAR